MMGHLLWLSPEGNMEIPKDFLKWRDVSKLHFQTTQAKVQRMNCKGVKLGEYHPNYIALGSGWVMTMAAQPGEVSDKNSKYDTYYDLLDEAFQLGTQIILN